MNKDNASTPSTSSSLLHQLLSRSSTASPATIEEDAPAPLPAMEEDAPIPVLHLSDDEDVDWEVVPISTAHPNYWNPDLHDLVIEELFSDHLFSSPPENDESWRTLIPHPVELSPLPPSPTTSPPPSTTSSPTSSPPSPTSSPPASPSYLPAAAFDTFRPPPPTSLPVRRLHRQQLWHDVYYLIWTWETTETNNIYRLYSLDFEEILEVYLPFSILPTRDQLLHHLFDSSLYLRQSHINGRPRITFHP